MTLMERWHCPSRVHCEACRGDRKFRETLVAAGLVDEPEFECFLKGQHIPTFKVGFRKKGCGSCKPIVVKGIPI